MLFSWGASACDQPVGQAATFDPWMYSASVRLEQFVAACSTRFPALAPALKDQQARFEALEPGMAVSRLAASQQPADQVEKLAEQSRADAEEELARGSRESDPERFCRWHLEDQLADRARQKRGGCGAKRTELPQDQDLALHEALLLRRVATLCRRESPALGEQAEQAVTGWESQNADLAAARATLAGAEPDETIASSASGMADFVFAFHAEMDGAEAACGDVVGIFSNAGRQEAAKKEAAEDAAVPPYERALWEMYGKTLSTRVLASVCAERFPGTAGDIAAAVAEWNRREARFIAEADAFAAQAAGGEDIDTAESEAEMRRFFAIAMKHETPGESGTFCRRSFKEIASGSWREREPKLFQTLSNGRPAD